jgi:hypothetical protein
MSTTNEMSEEQILDGLLHLERMWTRVQQEDESAGSAPPKPTPNRDAPPAPAPTQDPETRARLESLVQRAQQGDENVLPELRQVLDAHPEFWQRCGDLALQAQTAWLQLVSGKDLLLRESLQRKLEQTKAELAGTDPSVLERLLVQRVLSTWLQAEYADAMYARAKPNSSARHQALQRRQNSAQQRHLQAIKMLVTVRKLLSPAQATGEAQPRLFTPGAVG